MTDTDDRWEEIKPTLRIEEALEELGIEATSVRGDEWFAHCPLPTHHGTDANPSFGVNVDKLAFNCFTCGVGGTPVKLVMQVLGIGYDEALDWLAKFSDYTIYNDEQFLEQVARKLGTKTEEWRPKDEHVLPWYPVSRVEDWSRNLLHDPSFWRNDELVLDGRNRHISRDVAEYLKLGVASEHQRGSHVGPALIIPVIDGDQCVGWQERWLGERPDWVPKYTNTSDFPRAQTVYNAKSLQKTHPVIVVESPMTVGRLLTAGWHAVATFGAKVSPGQIKLLRAVPEVWLSFDNDDAGHAATKRVVEELEDFTSVWVIPPPQHEAKADLGDCDDDQLEATIEARVPALVYTSGI